LVVSKGVSEKKIYIILFNEKKIKKKLWKEMTSKLAIVYNSKMVDEAALASVIKHFSPTSEFIDLPARSEDISFFKGKDHIVFVGTFWFYTVSCAIMNKIKVSVFTRGAKYENIKDEFVTYHNIGDGSFEFESADQHFLRAWIDENINIPTSVTKAFFRQHKELLEVLRDRPRSGNGDSSTVSDTFFSGVYNEERSPIDVFNAIWEGKTDWKTILENGRRIIDVSVKMASDRAKNNSRTYTTKDGKVVCITNAPELINLTHQALKRGGEGAGTPPDITITVKFDFSREESDGICISMRGDGVMTDYILPLGGGGNADAAGARVETFFLRDILPQ
jgi:hypothetical protein